MGSKTGRRLLDFLRAALVLLIAVSAFAVEGPETWPAYGNDAGGSRYSSLSDINRGNVRRLRPAWTFHTGELPRLRKAHSQWAFECTPILAGGILFVSTPLNRIIALDPENGRAIWSFDPGIDTGVEYPNKLESRGVAYWDGGGETARRIFFGTNDGRLLALDAATGRLCEQFGKGGTVDLNQGIGHARPGEYSITSPPVVIGHLVVVGSAIADNVRADAPSGVVRAFDVKSGALEWSWDPIAELRKSHTSGAANAWTTMSADPQRGLLFVATSSPSPDYYGGLRPGDDRNADSIVALSAKTGEVVWAFQTVHHDVWDYDLASQPSLLDVTIDGQSVPAVAQASKTGHLFILDRTNGRPLFGVEERAVPQNGAAGDSLSPTQPFPLLPPALVPQKLEAKDAWGTMFFDRCACRKKLASLRSEGIFTPPVVGGSVLFPGPIGGMAWGGVAIARDRGLIVASTNRVATEVRLIDRNRFRSEKAGAISEMGPQEGTPYGIRRDFLLSPFRLPCNRPPWGTLTAIDSSTGRIRWEVPLGRFRVGPFLLPMKWGTPSLGGPIVTGGGLVFIAATMDETLRAFDVENGHELWHWRLPGGGQATPMTYRWKGRQYVVVSAGGHTRLGTKQSDSVMAFALP